VSELVIEVFCPSQHRIGHFGDAVLFMHSATFLLKWPVDITYLAHNQAGGTKFDR